MGNKVDDTISELRGILHAANDAELAKKLRIDKSTVSSWRSRGRVPDRFTAIIDGDVHEHRSSRPEVWGELEETAFGLALLRHSIAFRNLANLESYEMAMKNFRQTEYFWLIMHGAIEDVQELVKSKSFDLSGAFAVLLHNDLQRPDDTAVRELKRLKLEFTSAIVQKGGTVRNS